MLYFFRLIKGFLTIKIWGQNAEQILNSANKNGVEIWNLKYKDQSIIGNISIKNFYMLRKFKRGTKCHISIVKKHGIIFRLKKHKKRTGFITGLIVYVAILYLLTNYVWIINIEGNKNILTSDVINACKKIGIYEGINKNKISNKYDAQRLQLIQDGISWCSLNLEGCVLTVNLSETIISDKEERQIPSNIKATFDGKIKKINVKTGNTLVKVGDTVSKGDLLVSGVVENMSSTLFIHSEGEIIAETKRVFSAKGDFLQEVTYETENTETRKTVIFFCKKFPLYLGNIKNPHTYEKQIKNFKLFNKNIPIKIFEEKYTFTQIEKATYNEKTLEDKLYDDIKKQIESYNFVSVSEGKKDITYTDSGILLKLECVCEENIALQDKILIDTQN